MLPGDGTLVQIVDAAMAEAARLSGEWLLCRPGCTMCCLGPFPINQLDAERLRRGLEDLEARDPARAAAVRERTRLAYEKMAPDFPGDLRTGVIMSDDEAFAERYTDEPCPVLDPATGTCDLYAARPITCRTFGPPARYAGSDALGICELCYRDASDEQIAACQVHIDPDGLEFALLEELGREGETYVAFALMADETEPAARGSDGR